MQAAGCDRVGAGAHGLRIMRDKTEDYVKVMGK